MALEKLTKIDGGGISTTSDYRVGVITATKFVGPVEGSITATDASFSGNVSIAGTLTYEDVTNIDSVGVITARDGIKIPFDNKFLLLGQSNDLSLAHTAGHSYIADTGTGGLYLTGSNVRIQNATQNEDIAVFNQNDSVDLYFNNTKRFETKNTGAVVSGILTVTGNMNVEGVLTYQDVTNIDSIGIITARSNIDCNGSLDVDGHTDLDNVSIAGVTTMGQTTIFTLSLIHI